MPQTHGSNEELTNQALRLYLEKTRQELTESKSWIRQPSNFISAVAIVLSLLSIGYQLVKDYYDGIDKNLAALSTVVSDLTKLDSDVLNTTIKDPQILENLGITIANRRTALLAEADRLITDLGTRAPHVQLAVLGPEYMQVNDYGTALKYFDLLTRPPASRSEQVAAWRSIAIARFSQGPKSLAEARKAFQNAVNLYPDPQDLGAIGVEFTVHEQWARLELAGQHYLESAEQFGEAQTLLRRLPCSTDRAVLLSRIESESAPSLARLAAVDHQAAVNLTAVWTRARATDSCSIETSVQPVSPATVETTTVCRFTSGPRNGTTFDYASYGVQPIPVGSPCTDGQGSNGVGAHK